jgi:hypothetical protein
MKLYKKLLFACIVASTAVLITPKNVAGQAYAGRYWDATFTSEDLRCCVDAAGLCPVYSGKDPEFAMGECGLRFTFYGSIGIKVVGNALDSGYVDLYFGGRYPLMNIGEQIDARGNVRLDFYTAGIQGQAKIINGVMYGTVWEAYREWKYGEFSVPKH